MANIKKELADDLVEIAIQEVKTAFNFKKDRMEDIRLNEEFYYGRKIKVPKGRFGVPLPTMPGFVDTLMSKIDDPPALKYSYTDLADLKLAQKISSAWELESRPIRGNWPQKDRFTKKLACFSGRAIYKIYAESKPYKHHLEVTDHEDFGCEPKGGGDLEKHLFCGADNIFRSKAELEEKAVADIYDARQVRILAQKITAKDFKETADLYKGRNRRFKQLGLNMEDNTYVGQSMYRLIEWGMTYNGKRYYLLFDFKTGTWIRAELLKDVFSSNKWPWESWATHEDAFNFWSKAPCDDMRPVADGIDTLFNQALENRQKRNFGQRAYDPEVFEDPSELEWRPDGLAVATTSKGKSISQGIYEFKTEEISGTIDMIAFMDNFLGRKTGVTPEATGAPGEKEEKVGIYFGRLQQVADRLGLYNKSYRECWERLGLKYAWGLYDHLTEPMAVKMIGLAGVEWDDLVRGEAKKAPDLDIEVTGGSAEVAANAEKSKKRENVLGLILKSEILQQFPNPAWLFQKVLEQGEYEESDIREAMSKESVSKELLSEAEQSIQEIIKGKSPKLNRGANTAFVQRIVDFAMDKDVENDIYKKLMAYAQAHIPIAIENMTRMARLMVAGRGEQPAEKKPTLEIAEGMKTEEPIPGAPGAGISSGVKASNILRGRSPATQ